MKKTVLVFSAAVLFLAGFWGVALSQEQPKPKRDTVNIDTDAKPTFYYAEEETSTSKKGIPLVAIVAGAAVVIAAGAFLIIRKKK
jgi:hypothetical protein